MNVEGPLRRAQVGIAFERDKIQGAVRTDFVLSAEIIVIGTLGIWRRRVTSPSAPRASGRFRSRITASGTPWLRICSWAAARLRAVRTFLSPKLILSVSASASHISG